MNARAHWLALPNGQRDALWASAVGALTVLPLLPRLPLWAGIAAMLLLGWRAVLAWRRRPLPSRAWLGAALLLAVGAAAAQFHTLLGRDPGVTLVSLLLGLKLLESRRRRDAYVVFYLGLFAVSASTLYAQSPAAAAWMLVCTLGWLTALLDANLPGERPPLRARVLTALRLLGLGLPLMLALYLLFPRLPGPLWALPQDARHSTGLSDSMDPGAIAELAQDDSVAFRVRFSTARPPERALYWRGPVLSVFDGHSWRQSGADLADASPALRTQGPAWRYTVTLESTRQVFVPALDAPDAAPNLSGQPATTVRRLRDLQLVASRPLTQITRYSLLAYTDFAYGPLRMSPELQSLTAVPEGLDPRTVALARGWAVRARQAGGGAEPAVAQAVAGDALRMFRREPFRYSLNPGAYEGPDAIDQFLFARRVGFCEHYAQAFVVLMRAAGIPARIVTGYQGGRENPVDDTWVVRQSDAHAWAEYWVEGRGWVRADPTAAVDPARVDRSGQTLAARGSLLGIAALGPRDAAMLLDLRNLGDALNNAWNQWVLDYGQTRQRALLQRLGMSRPDTAHLLGAMSAAVVAVLGVAAGLSLRRRDAQADAWQRAYALARRRLARVGLKAGPAEPAGTLAARAGALASGDDRWSAWRDVLLELERLRYARDGGEPGRLRALGRRIARLRPPRRLTVGDHGPE